MSTANGGPVEAMGAIRLATLFVAMLAAACSRDASLPFERDFKGRTTYSLRVPEGNYRVTVSLEAGADGMALVLAEQRRLMTENPTKPGEKLERSFNVNVRTASLGALPENATGGTSVTLKARERCSPTWDDELSIQVIGASLRRIRIEPVSLPTLYLAGDSTVTDQPEAPHASWGQFLTRYFDAGIVVANHAESGETLKSFMSEHRLDKLLSGLKAGDWVMIQFGHNDQKKQWPQTYSDAATTYRSWLRSYVAEIRSRGATPILVTSPERRRFDPQGRQDRTLGDYPEAMREVAREENLALIDLNEMTVRFHEALGPGQAPRAFANDGRDPTHHNLYGARSLARMVIEGVRTADPALTAGLAAHLSADAGTFDPSHPPPPPRQMETW